MTTSTDPRRALGQLGERFAAEHLERAGYLVLARNYRTRFGELDIVAADDRCLVFCEVKARVAGTREGPAGPLDAIGPGSGASSGRWRASGSRRRAARQRPHRPDLRFDAIGVVVTSRGVLLSIEHLEDAF